MSAVGKHQTLTDSSLLDLEIKHSMAGSHASKPELRFLLKAYTERIEVRDGQLG